MSIEQQRSDASPIQAVTAHRTANPVSYRVPHGALDSKEDNDDEIILDLQDVSVDEKTQPPGGMDPYFKTKLHWLSRKLRKLHSPDAKAVKLEVDRNDIFRDSFRAFARMNGEQLKGPLHVRFRKEDGRDDGGLTRHWFMLISREIVNPEYAMFMPTTKNDAFQVHPASKHQAHYLDYFRFIGRVLGKAVYDGFLVEAHLAPTIYKHILGLDIGRCDMMSVDSVYHQNLQWILDDIDAADLDICFSASTRKSLAAHVWLHVYSHAYGCLQWILDNDIDAADLDIWILDNDIDAADLDIFFSVDSEEFGCVTQIELKEGGGEIKVTNANKEEYVDLACRQRLIECVKPQGVQLEALKSGFYEIMDPTVLTGFTETELELVLCGLPVIDLDDWKRNSEYKAGYAEDNEVIRWFWELLEDWDQEMRARLLQFVTGTSKLPMGGFSKLYGATGPKRFQIIRVFNTERLPQANTCFNELLLPPYHSKERLADCLTISIYDGGDVFALR